MANEKEIKKTNLLSEFKGAAIQDRTIFIQAWEHVFEESRNINPGTTEMLWNKFVQFSVSEFNKPFGFSLPGHMLPHTKNPILQGETPLPKRWFHAKTKGVLRYNPMTFRANISRYGDERYLFQNADQEALSIRTDAYAMAGAYRNLRYLIVYLLFSTPSDFKKLTSLGDDGNDGFNKDLYDLFTSKDSDDNYLFYKIAGDSLQKQVFKWKNGVPLAFGTNDGSAKAWETKTHELEGLLKDIQGVLASNIRKWKKSSLKGFGSEGWGDEETAEYFGYLDEIATVYRDATNNVTSKYNVGITDATGANTGKKEKAIEKMVSLNKDGLFITNSPNYNNVTADASKYLDDNPTIAGKSDLLLIINPDDMQTFKRILPLLPNPSQLSVANYIGIPEANIIQFNGVKKGEAMLINNKTIGIHPVGSIRPGTFNYTEFDLQNIWVDVRMHLVIWPYHCVKFSK